MVAEGIDHVRSNCEVYAYINSPSYHFNAPSDCSSKRYATIVAQPPNTTDVAHKSNKRVWLLWQWSNSVGCALVGRAFVSLSKNILRGKRMTGMVA